MNTGQMYKDVKVNLDRAADIHLYARPGGGLPTPDDVLEEIKKIY